MMSRFPQRGLFVTGTDTEVGKTFFCELLARQLNDAGCRVGVYKPAASGGEMCDGQVICDDATRLWEAAGRPSDISRVCPQMFQAAVAPHVAAEMEGRLIDEAMLIDGLAAWKDNCDLIIVEGAGGYMSPISNQSLIADVALAIGYPLVVVSANRLGTINQTLQTIRAIESYQGGLPIAGVVMNDVLPQSDDASLVSNPGQVARWIQRPLLTHIAWSQSALPDGDWTGLFGE
jgi:dethiobiotin synthetase